MFARPFVRGQNCVKGSPVLFLFAARIRLYGKTRLSLTYFRDKRRNRRKDSVRNVDNFAMLV